MARSATTTTTAKAPTTPKAPRTRSPKAPASTPASPVTTESPVTAPITPDAPEAPVTAQAAPAVPTEPKAFDYLAEFGAILTEITPAAKALADLDPADLDSTDEAVVSAYQAAQARWDELAEAARAFYAVAPAKTCAGLRSAVNARARAAGSSRADVFQAPLWFTLEESLSRPGAAPKVTEVVRTEAEIVAALAERFALAFLVSDVSYEPSDMPSGLDFESILEQAHAQVEAWKVDVTFPEAIMAADIELQKAPLFPVATPKKAAPQAVLPRLVDTLTYDEKALSGAWISCGHLGKKVTLAEDVARIDSRDYVAGSGAVAAALVGMNKKGNLPDGVEYRDSSDFPQGSGVTTGLRVTDRAAFTAWTAAKFPLSV